MIIGRNDKGESPTKTDEPLKLFGLCYVPLCLQSMQGRTTGCHILSLQIVRYAKELLLFYIGEAYLDDRELLVEMYSNSYRS